MDSLPIGLKTLKIKFPKLSSFIEFKNLPISLEKLYFTYKESCSTKSYQETVNLIKENTKLPFGCEMFINGNII